MAGIVSSEGVFDNDLSFTLPTSEETESLQYLIDSELALRIQETSAEESCPGKGADGFTEEFLNAERQHSDLCNGNSEPLDNAETLSAEAGVENDQTPSPEAVPAVEPPAPPSPEPSPEPASDPHPPIVLEMNLQNINMSGVETNTRVAQTNEESWTTVEEAAKDMLDCALEQQTIVICQTEETETIITEKKTKKKKTGTEGGEVTVTKTKKTKKSKKSDEKENHISVITNGHDMQEAVSPSKSTNELSNVCVKELKLTYVSEAAKTYNATKSLEEPVLPTVPIQELRRSFGDIHRACEDTDLNQSTDKDGQLKSSFSKFDQLSRKAFHVRSSDTAKAQKTFSQGGTDAQGNAVCKSCGKTVFAMEQIKAERAVWHKNCFRCKTCNKQLTVDIYSSHEGELYCKPHFKELFKPKVVVEQDEEPVRRRKPEMIIRENQPIELPPDVVRASDKADLGLEELSSLNVKSRFQVFERQESGEADGERSLTPVNVKRSPSILSKLARFQKKGMDIGVTDESLNGFVYEESASSEEEEEDDDEEEVGVVKCRKTRERPVSFNKMNDMKKSWECGQTARREEIREEHKKELQHLRSRLFMGKQGKMKELYEQAVAESEGRTGKKDLDTEVVRGEKAKAVREKFEKGELIHSDSDEEKGKQMLDEDMSVFEEGISKKSRSLFLEMDAHAAKAPPVAPPVPKAPSHEPVKKTREVYVARQPSEDIVRSSDTVEDVTVQTADLSSKFRFFETYKAPEVKKKSFRITPPRDGQVKTESPEREIYRDPDVVRADDRLDDEQIVKRSQTASKMLSIFRQMEEQKEVLPEGPKPKKCFTPPPDYKGDKSGSSEEESDEEDEEEEEESEEETEEDDNIVRSSHKIKDESLEQARKAARAKALAAKFEKWEPEKQSTNNAINMLDSDNPSIDSTKSLRARFESLKTEQPKEKPRAKVNRFV